MTICNVLGMMPIGDNTAIIVDNDGELFRNGIGILDEEGRPFEVLSVGMDSGVESKDMMDKTSLLVKGKFTSNRIFV